MTLWIRWEQRRARLENYPEGGRGSGQGGGRCLSAWVVHVGLLRSGKDVPRIAGPAIDAEFI